MIKALIFICFFYLTNVLASKSELEINSGIASKYNIQFSPIKMPQVNEDMSITDRECLHKEIFNAYIRLFNMLKKGSKNECNRVIDTRFSHNSVLNFRGWVLQSLEGIKVIGTEKDYKNFIADLKIDTLVNGAFDVEKVGNDEWSFKQKKDIDSNLKNTLSLPPINSQKEILKELDLITNKSLFLAPRKILNDKELHSMPLFDKKITKEILKELDLITNKSLFLAPRKILNDKELHSMPLFDKKITLEPFTDSSRTRNKILSSH